MSSSRSLPKSITFNGVGNWKALYAKFEAFRKQAGWTQLQCRNELQWCLKVAASAFHTTLIEQKPNPIHKQIVAHLKKRYGFQAPPEVVQMELAIARPPRPSRLERETGLKRDEALFHLSHGSPMIPVALAGGMLNYYWRETQQ